MSEPIMDRAGQRILIWGAHRPVAAAVAARFVDSGAHVIVLEADRGVHGDVPEAAERLALDPGNPRDLRTLGKQLAEDEQGLDVLVMLHEEMRLGMLEESSVDDWQASLKTNLHLPLQVAQAALPALKKARGNIVLLGSIGAPFAYDGFGPVGVARASLHALSKYMACEWMNDHIRVNTVAVGVIADDAGSAEGLRIERAKALPRDDHEGLHPGFTLPGEIVDVVDFITSERARWLTGQVLMTDGGMSLGLNFDFFLEATSYT